jgi:hypothetical protein
LCSDRRIEILIANPSKIHFGQEVLHGDLQILYYDLGDRYTLTPKIKEDIEFQKVIIVKLKPEKISSLKIEWISSVCTLKTNTFLPS